MTKNERIGLGGGCHWCTEGVFVMLAGVSRVAQGWIASVPPYDEFAEAVIVHFNPSVISVEQLITVHLETHAATVNHPLRAKYRSAVYSFDATKEEEHRGVLARLKEGLEGELLTRVLPFVSFRSSLDEHLDYFRRDPERPFCRRYITPKLIGLRMNRPELFYREKQ